MISNYVHDGLLSHPQLPQTGETVTAPIDPKENNQRASYHVRALQVQNIILPPSPCLHPPQCGLPTIHSQ